MKNGFIKTACITLAALCLTGCGKASSPDAENAAEAESSRDYIYASETVTKIENTRNNALAVTPAVLTEDGYYALGGRKSEQNTPEGAVEEYEGQFDIMEPLISFVSLDGKISELENYSPVAVESEGEGKRDFRVSRSIEGLLLRSDGKLESIESVFVSYCDASDDVAYSTDEYYSNLTTEESCFIRILETDGSEISCAEFDAGEDSRFYNIMLDGNDNLIVLGDTSVEAYSDSGEKLYSAQTDGYLYGMTTLRDGRIGVLSYPMSGSSLSLLELDAKAGEIADTIAQVGLDAYDLLNGGGDYDFYLYGGSGLYGYSLENSSSEKLVDWAECDIVAGRLCKIQTEPDGSIKAFSTSYDEKSEVQTTELISITKHPWNPSDEKEHLTLASVYADDVLRDNIIDFNRAHDSIRIDLKDYSEYNTDDDYSAGYTKLISEIAAGDVPDIIDMSTDMPYRRLAASGVLEDLYPYLDADPELSRSDFFENLMHATEVDGKMYMACAGFGVYTAVGASSVVGDTPGWTYEDYNAALAKMPEGCDGFGTSITKDTMLSMSLAFESDRFMDWNTGKCSFDSPEFVELLEFCNSFYQAFDDDDYSAYIDDPENLRIAEGRQMLSMCILTSTDYMLTDYDKLFGGESTFVGFPTSDGVGNMFVLTNSLAMSSRCKDKQAAWEFIRTYLTEDYQAKCYYIPTNKNLFESQLADAMTEKFETDANGNYKLDANGDKIPRSIGSYFDGVNEVTVYYLSKRQAEQIKSTVASTSKVLNFDQSIEDIVTEGAQAFFAGQKSAEECAKLIQSKANIYINEQR